MVARKLLFFVLLLFLIPLLMIAGCSKEVEQEEEEGYIAVEVSEVSKGEIILTAQSSGTIHSSGEVAVVARLGGEVKSVRVSLGDSVKKGDVLVTLSAPDISLQVRQAREGVASLRESRDELQDMIDELEELLEDIRDPGENDEENGEDNGNDNGIDFPDPPIEVDDLPQWLRDLLENGGLQLDPAITLRQQLATLEAQLKQAERSLEMAELGLSNLTVKAPVAGIVTYMNAITGSTVGPGSPLLIISGDDDYQIEAMVLESLITFIKVGDHVEIELPIRGESYSGTVAEVAPAPLPNTRLYPVKVSFNPTGQVLPGMFTRLFFVTEASGETVLIPRAAVLKRQEGDRVYVVQGERAESRAVTLGMQNRDRVQVLSGLQPGDMLVVKGQEYLQDGALLKIVGRQPPTGEGADH